MRGVRDAGAHEPNEAVVLLVDEPAADAQSEGVRSTCTRINYDRVMPNGDGPELERGVLSVSELTAPVGVRHTTRGAMFTGLVVASAWLAYIECARMLVMRWYPQGEIGGTPLWRMRVGLHSQLFVFPGLLLWASRTDGAEGVRRWADECGLAGVRAGRATWAWFWTFLFFMALDFVRIEMNGMMRTHHTACLVGHFYAAFVLPRGFPHYMLGATALELGSACCNLVWLNPTSVPIIGMYFVGMTASNGAALWCARRWCALPSRWLTCVFAYGLTLTLATTRELQAIAIVWKTSVDGNVKDFIHAPVADVPVV